MAGVCPDFPAFAKQYDGRRLVPVWREMLVDVETPVSAFAKLDDGGCAYLLESAEQGRWWGRYSFLGLHPFLVYGVKGGEESYRYADEDVRVEQIAGHLLDGLGAAIASVPVAGVPSSLIFPGGAVGYLGYDVIKSWEKVPRTSKPDLGLPECWFMWAQDLVVFDHLAHRIKVLTYTVPDDESCRTAYRNALSRIDCLFEELLGGSPTRPAAKSTRLAPSVSSNTSPSEFMDAVRRIQRHIRRGDVFQTVLSQRLSRQLTVPAFDVYRVLRSLNPSPYMYFLRGDGFTLVGSSPEIMVRQEPDRVVLRPIAGTRPRGATPEEDGRLARELADDVKERAEHIMLVDLGRNDLGRVCRYGTVRMRELMSVERYSHVMHLVSEVEGKLRDGLGSLDLLRACFPAGTVSGAPKVRAMQLIEELESTLRGPYAGAVGYFSFAGTMDTCITIRTMVVQDEVAYVQAGAGIVADSDPEREYQETMHKARALLRAIDLAERGETWLR